MFQGIHAVRDESPKDLSPHIAIFRFSSGIVKIYLRKKSLQIG
jgi:hypothetical protein